MAVLQQPLSLFIAFAVLFRGTLCNHVDVEILDGFGHVRLELGSDQKFECVATGEDLNGTFIWSIGEQDLPHPIQKDKVVDEYDSDFWIQKSSVKFKVEKKHHDKKLICKYVNLLDGNRVEILNEDSLSLGVYYLQIPDSVLLGHFEEGEDVRLVVEFAMFPSPEEGEVYWEMIENNGKRERFVPKERSEYGLYAAEKLKNLGSDRFRAAFKIVNADLGENMKQFFLVVGKDNKESRGSGKRKTSIDFQIVIKQKSQSTTGMDEYILINTIKNNFNDGDTTTRSHISPNTMPNTYSEDEAAELRFGIVAIVIVAILFTMIIYLVGYCLLCRNKDFSRVPVNDSRK